MSTATEIIREAEDTRECDPPYPITADQYWAMVEGGIIPYDRPVYLWGGRLLEKMAKTRAHYLTQDVLHASLIKVLPAGYFVGGENAVRLDPTHMPLPDLIVVRGEAFDYAGRDIEGPDLMVVVEVAFTSLRKDLGERMSLYAATAPSAVYLVADVRNKKTYVHRRPRPDPGRPGLGLYEEVEEVGPGGTVRLSVDGVALAPIPFDDLIR